MPTKHSSAFQLPHRTARLLFVLLVVLFFSLLITTTHAYTLLGDREIRLSSSEPGASNNYQVDFDVSTNGDLGGIVITFCADSPIINDTNCEAPDDFNLTNALASLNFGDIDLSGYYATTQEHTSTGSATNTAVITPGVIPNHATWSEIESINAGSTVRTDHLLESQSGNLFWSFGSSWSTNTAYLYRSTDGGVSWSQVESVTIGGTIWTDHLLETSSGDLLWSFGSQDSTAYLYRSTDGGSNWSQVESVSTGGTIGADHLLESQSGNLFWSFGSNDNTAYLYRSTDGGVSWSQAESVSTGGIIVTDYMLKNQNDYLFWSFGSTDNTSYLYRSTDGGVNWIEVESINAGSNLSDNYLLEAKDGNLFWSFTSTFNNSAFLYGSTDGGLNWTQLEEINTCCNVHTNHLLESDGALLWSFGDSGGAYLYRSTDNGDNWSQEEYIFTGDSVFTDHLLVGKNADLFWSFGSDDNVAYLYRSTDGGVSWSQVESVTTGGNVNTDHLLETSNGNLFWSFGSSDNTAYLWSPNADPAPVVSVTSGESAQFELVDATNPSSLGTFYARIYTYADSTHALGYTLSDPSAGGAVIDAGGIALSTAQLLTIEAKVQERLTFCLFTADLSDPGDYETCSHAVPDIIALGDDNGVLDPILPSVSKSAKYNITTNASQGATVRMKGTTLTAGSFSIDPVGDATPGDGIAQGSSPGTEQFGLCVYTDPSSVDTAMTSLAPYNDVACAGTTDGQAPGNDNSANFAFNEAGLETDIYGDAVALKPAGAWSTGRLVFLANISDTTEPGIYNTTFDVIATGRY